MASIVLLLHGTLHFIDKGHILATQYGWFREAGDLADFLTSPERIRIAIQIVAFALIAFAGIGILCRRRLAARIAFWALILVLLESMFYEVEGVLKLIEWINPDRLGTEMLWTAARAYWNLASSCFPILFVFRPMWRLMRLI